MADLTVSANVQTFLASANAAAMRTNLGSIATGLTGTLPVTNGGLGIATGTSGGIPYFSGSTTIASSGALALNSIVIGGGAGASPTTTTTGTGILTFLGTPTSANLLAAITDETGTGSLVFSISPTFTGTVTADTVTATTGNVTTLNVTSTFTLAENVSIALDPAGSADGKYTGISVTGTSGYAQAFGDLVMLDPNQSPARWELASVSAAAGAVGDCRGTLAMVVVTGTDGNSCTLLLQGIIRADANFPTFTVNGAVYATTTGDVTNTQPSTTDHVIRIIGSALTTDEMYFAPDKNWITHT